MSKKKRIENEDDKVFTESSTRKRINQLYEENEYDSVNSLRHRARSITCGTAFGGVVEISMRTENNFMYAQMQPTECIEFIEQLAAGVGVEIAMRPKIDFSSWRGWEEVIDQRIGFDKIAWKGAAAWQLNGDHIEEQRKRLHSEKEEPKALEESKPKKRTRKKSKETEE